MAVQDRYATRPFDEAIAYLDGKINLPTDSWRDIRDDEHDAAFVVAGAKGSILNDLRRAVERSLVEGQTLEDFSKEFDRISEGWAHSGDKDWRARIIYQTNVRMAHAAGRNQYQLDPDVLRVQPYRQYVHGGSDKPRPSHLALDGQVFFATEVPFELPNGYGCFPPGTPVATANGWVSIEQIKPGSYVFGCSGDLKLVRQAHKRPYNGELIRIETSEGRTTATPNHRFLTERGWVEAGRLNVGDVIFQVPEAASFDSPVGDVNQVDSRVGDLLVPSPANRMLGAFNPKRHAFNLDVNPVGAAIEVVGASIAPFLQGFHHQRFTSRWLSLGIQMLGGISSECLEPALVGPGSNFRFKKTARGLELLCHQSSPWVSIFGLAKTWVIGTLLLCRNVSHDLGRNLFPVGVSLPLHSDSLTGVPSRYVGQIQKLHDRSVAASPALSKALDSVQLTHVKSLQRLLKGLPLDRLYSLDAPVDLATAHLNAFKVASVDRVYYEGAVHNLTVETDESYCVPVGVAHNCSCRYISLSERDLEDQGLTISGLRRGDLATTTIDGQTYEALLEPAEGFDYTPGLSNAIDRRAKLENILDRATPTLRSQIEAELDRIDQERLALRVTPQGTPVRQALPAPKGPNAKPFNHVLEVIDQVHGDGSLPKIPTVLVPPKGSKRGRYSYDPTKGGAISIEVQHSLAKSGFVYAHEIGHFLDHHGLGDGRSFGTRTNPQMAEFFQAIEATPLVQGLRDALQTGTLNSRAGDRNLSQGSKDYIDYLLLPEEIWARSYSQWLTLRSGDGELAKGLREAQGSTNAYTASMQWDDKEFAPVAATIDDLFKTLGWIR